MNLFPTVESMDELSTDAKLFIARTLLSSAIQDEVASIPPHMHESTRDLLLARVDHLIGAHNAIVAARDSIAADLANYKVPNPF